MNDKKIRLLLIEDDKVDQMAFERFVKNMASPYDYTIVGSVAEAAEILKSTRFDVIISDYMLGDGTGLELFDLFKGLPVIITTGSGNEEVAVEAMKLGACDYIIKDPEGNYLKTLPATVELALKRKQTEKELQNHQENLEFMVEKRTAELRVEIIERKQAEEELHKSEEKFRALYNNSPDMLVSVSPDDAGILLCNETLLKKTGYLKEEVIGAPVFKMYHDDCMGEVKKTFQQFVETGVVKNKELILKRKDGSKINVSLNVDAIRDDNGKILYSLSSWRDITEKIKLEEQLHQAQKMESIGRLAGGVAHDYNNALSAIIGFTELAMAKEDLPESLRDDLNEVLKAAGRATDITRQLLAFARKQTIAPRVLDLNVNVESMLKMLRRLIGEDINLAWLPGASLWPVKLDPSQVDQILANLCVNARDAIDDVGKITIETENTHFDEDYCADHPGFNPGGFVLLAVSDNGCGMDKEILDNIFEPFFTTKDVDKGTGLGLATVYGIVKQNNGFVNVYSEPDKGTTFKIYLPRHEGEGVDLQEKITTKILPGRGETVLVVEDDLQILKLARQILEGLDYSVLTAGTPAEAMGLAEEHAGEIHLLVTDVIMPEMNGQELAQRLQSLYPSLKRMFMSGYTADVIAHHGVLKKGVHFIQKPFSKRDLATTVRKALDSEN